MQGSRIRFAHKVRAQGVQLGRAQDVHFFWHKVAHKVDPACIFSVLVLGNGHYIIYPAALGPRRLDPPVFCLLPCTFSPEAFLL